MNRPADESIDCYQHNKVLIKVENKPQKSFISDLFKLTVQNRTFVDYQINQICHISAPSVKECPQKMLKQVHIHSFSPNFLQPCSFFWIIF